MNKILKNINGIAAVVLGLQLVAGCTSIKLSGRENGARVAYEYNSLGDITRESFDNDGDREIDDTVNIEYSNSGRKIYEVHRTTVGKGLCEIKTFEFDAQGRVISESTYRDGEFDQQVDRTITHEYGPNGRETRTTYDFDKSGRTIRKSTEGYNFQRNVTGDNQDSNRIPDFSALNGGLNNE